MAPPATIGLRTLTAAEQAAVQQLVRASSARLAQVRRATALLAVAEGQSFAQAARQAGFRSRTTIANLVDRFPTQGLAALTIAPGRGRPPTYAAGARARIVATAQPPPERRTDGSATWSLTLLQRRLRHAGLARIGTSTIRRVLQAAGSSYQRTRSWCPTGSARRVRTGGSVTVSDPQTEQKQA